MATKLFGVDFGTDSLKIYQKGLGMVYDQRTVLAMKGKNYIAVGNEAYEMYGKAPEYINIDFPVKKGVIASIDKMLAFMNCVFMDMSREYGKIRGAKFYICVPSDITDVEKKAFYDIIDKSFIRPRKIYMIDKPVANAKGLGIDIDKSKGTLIVDIGADTTEISIIANGGVVISRLIPVGGRALDEVIVTHLRRCHNLVIGDKSAEALKKKVASFNEIDKYAPVYGRDVVSGLPMEKKVTTKEIRPVIGEPLNIIIDNIRQILERTPPEISADIFSDGMYLVGGSSRITGIDDYIEDAARLKVHLTPDPSGIAALGLGVIMEDDSFFNNK